MAVLSLVAAAPGLRCRTKPVLTGLLGSPVDWALAGGASRPVPRPLAVLLGSHLAPRSPRGVLAGPGQCGKAALRSSWDPAPRWRSPLVATSSAGSRHVKQSNGIQCLSAEETHLLAAWYLGACTAECGKTRALPEGVWGSSFASGSAIQHFSLHGDSTCTDLPLSEPGSRAAALLLPPSPMCCRAKESGSGCSPHSAPRCQWQRLPPCPLEQCFS